MARYTAAPADATARRRRKRGWSPAGRWGVWDRADGRWIHIYGGESAASYAVHHARSLNTPGLFRPIFRGGAR
jgi:hypothetical protein